MKRNKQKIPKVNLLDLTTLQALGVQALQDLLAAHAPVLLSRIRLLAAALRRETIRRGERRWNELWRLKLKGRSRERPGNHHASGSDRCRARRTHWRGRSAAGSRSKVTVRLHPRIRGPRYRGRSARR